MCGICGFVGKVHRAELDVMTDSMAHRGPDGRGVEMFDRDRPAGLGHRRLAILDPTPAGAQPMVYADRWWLTYNGEIYNYPELKADLERAGERFATSCDTEVLLRLFALEGPAMLDRLNGIFAFAVWDDVEQRMFVARDRLGVKPLYYIRRDGLFAFASELRALLPLVGSATLDPEGLADYLTLLWVPDPRTAFKEVTKLPPGHFAWYDRDELTIKQYWDLRFDPESRSDAAWIDAVGDTVSRSVQRQLLSDVPLGSFLSGGVDSSAIVAAVSRHGRASTYTLGFDEEDLRHEIVPDDLVHARNVAQKFQTDHHDEILQPDVLDLLPKAVWHLEEPVADPAAISTYLICREAGKRMKVMLSGMGADEVFAGYPRHLAYRITRFGDALPHHVMRALQGLARPLAHPGPPGRLRGPRRNLWKYMRAAELEPFDRYLSFGSYYARAELDRVLAPDVRGELRDYDPLGRHREYLTDDTERDELASILYLDAKTFLPCLNLTYTDKMSMAASVEVRVPLLDDELVALGSRIPSRLKLRGWRRKYIFKKSQEAALPRSIVWRPKAGFGAPVRSWLVKDLTPLVEELLGEQALRSRGLVDPHEVAAMRLENELGRADYSLRLYSLLNLELWCRTWVDTPWTFERLARASASSADPATSRAAVSGNGLGL